MMEQPFTRKSVPVSRRASGRQGCNEGAGAEGNSACSESSKHISKGEAGSKAPHNKGIAGLSDEQAKALAEWVRTIKQEERDQDRTGLRCCSIQ